MLALLAGAGAVYFVLGDLQEGLVLLAFAMISIVITVIQEARTERVVQALRDLTSPRALVIRDGERRRIAGREVVEGDLIVVSEGDRVPADATIAEAHGLRADESMLTGESVPVRKASPDGQAPADARPGGDDLPYLFSGTLIVGGTGIAEVTATGPRSELGRIGQSLSTVENEPPRLRLQTQRIVGIFALAGGAVSVLVVVLYGLFRSGWLNAILAGIAVGMSMLPEEFPVVLTVFMAMGAWRISQAKVLTRRGSAIETLGSATVLCTDKTGTLTQNRMSIVEIRLKDGSRASAVSGQALAGPFRDAIRSGALASSPEAFDPMDRAFRSLADEQGLAPAGDWLLERVYGLRADLLALSQCWKADGGYMVATKGAPEAILQLCRSPDHERRQIIEAAESMAMAGLRVLGVARASFDGPELPDDPRAFQFQFLGLVGLADPLRPEVRDAMADCRAAGIRVVMITGDYPATARAIAGQAGLQADSVVTGQELDKLDDAELARRVRSVTIFARTMPEQKLRIVSALKSNGEIVAMTGDGVNDAPSLKAAHIGIAMGGRGTDVAREASSIVLLEDDFASIVKAVRLGRRIYDNLRKAMAFIFAAHVPIAGLALLPLVLGLPVIFGPVHIAFLEMVIDPVCTLVFEAETEERNVMTRPPRSSKERLFPAQLVSWSLFQGFLAFAAVALVYVVASRRGMPETDARALAFFCLIVAIVTLILVNRAFGASVLSALRRRNAALKYVLLSVAGALGMTLVVPGVRHLFRFGPLHPDDLLLVAGIGLSLLVVLEFLKVLWRPSFARPGELP
jgi:Ca2+-transporting ATPase